MYQVIDNMQLLHLSVGGWSFAPPPSWGGGKCSAGERRGMSVPGMDKG